LKLYLENYDHVTKLRIIIILTFKSLNNKLKFYSSIQLENLN